MEAHDEEVDPKSLQHSKWGINKRPSKIGSCRASWKYHHLVEASGTFQKDSGRPIQPLKTWKSQQNLEQSFGKRNNVNSFIERWLLLPSDKINSWNSKAKMSMCLLSYLETPILMSLKMTMLPSNRRLRQGSQGFASLLPSKYREEAEALRLVMHVSSWFQETQQGVSRDKGVSWNKIQHNWGVSNSLGNPFHFSFKWNPATSKKQRRPWTCQYQSCPSKRCGFPGAQALASQVSTSEGRIWVTSKTDPFWKSFFQVFSVEDSRFCQLHSKAQAFTILHKFLLGFRMCSDGSRGHGLCSMWHFWCHISTNPAKKKRISKLKRDHFDQNIPIWHFPAPVSHSHFLPGKMEAEGNWGETWKTCKTTGRGQRKNQSQWPEYLKPLENHTS